MTEGQKNQDAQKATIIAGKGWRQGSILDPRVAKIDFPPGFQLQGDEYLIVCTQSCSVVSPRFQADPNIELMVATPAKKFNARAPEATGKNARKLLLSLTPACASIAIECDFNRRFFCSRHLLTEIDPFSKLQLAEGGAAMLAAWLARAYTRIALPDVLVERMRQSLLDAIARCLETPYGDDLVPVHQHVPLIYLKWTPKDERADVYKLNFQFICDELGAVETLDQVLLNELSIYGDHQPHDGIILLEYASRLDSETFLTDLDAYDRLSEWDHLSNLVDLISDAE